MGIIRYEPDPSKAWGNQPKPTGSAASFEMKGDLLAFKIEPETAAAIRTNFNPHTLEDWLITAKSQFDLDDSNGAKLTECKSTYTSPTTGRSGLGRTKKQGNHLPKEITYGAEGKTVVVDNSTPSKARDSATKKKKSVENVVQNKAFHKLGKSIT